MSVHTTGRTRQSGQSAQPRDFECDRVDMGEQKRAKPARRKDLGIVCSWATAAQTIAIEAATAGGSAQSQSNGGERRSEPSEPLLTSPAASAAAGTPVQSPIAPAPIEFAVAGAIASTGCGVMDYG
jgi:hypothetical protein